MVPDIFDRMKPRDVALAVAASNRIIIDALVEAQILDAESLKKTFVTKAQQMIGRDHEDQAGQLLMMLSGTVPKKKAGE